MTGINIIFTIQKLKRHVSTNKNITTSPKTNVNNLVGTNLNNSFIKLFVVLSKYKYLNIINETNVDIANAIAVTIVAEGINGLKIADARKSATTDKKPRTQYIQKLLFHSYNGFNNLIIGQDTIVSNTLYCGFVGSTVLNSLLILVIITIL